MQELALYRNCTKCDLVCVAMGFSLLSMCAVITFQGEIEELLSVMFLVLAACLLVIICAPADRVAPTFQPVLFPTFCLHRSSLW